MNFDTVQSVIRAILNVFAGGMAAKGYGDAHYWELVTAAVISIATMIWGVYHQKTKPKRHKRKKAHKYDEPHPAPPSGGKPSQPPSFND